MSQNKQMSKEAKEICSALGLKKVICLYCGTDLSQC